MGLLLKQFSWVFYKWFGCICIVIIHCIKLPNYKQHDKYLLYIPHCMAVRCRYFKRSRIHQLIKVVLVLKKVFHFLVSSWYFSMSFMSFIVFIPLVCACQMLVVLAWSTFHFLYTEEKNYKNWMDLNKLDNNLNFSMSMDMCQMCQLFEEIASGLIFHKLVSPTGSKQLKEMAWWRVGLLSILYRLVHTIRSCLIIYTKQWSLWNR